MARNRIRHYLDAVVLHTDWTSEDYEEQEKRLKEESDKLQEWQDPDQ